MSIAIDLFSGAGGAGAALADLGFTVIGVDNWNRAIETHELNDLYVMNRDLQQHISLNFPKGKARIVHGSPPCTPYSQATLGEGLRSEKDCTLGWLWHVEQIDAPLITMENVRGLTFKPNKPHLDFIVSSLETLGYKVTYGLIDASTWGYPQARKRFYLVGRKDGTPVIPQINRTPPSMGEFLGWDPDPQQMKLRLPNPGDPSWVFERPAVTVVGSFRPDIMAAPGWRTSSPRQAAPGAVRITLEEGARLQDFHPGWKFAGTKWQQWQLVGNAVIRGVMRELIEANL